MVEATLPSRFFVREYYWTGSGVEKEPVPELVSDIDAWGFPLQRIHGPLIVEGQARIVLVDLGRTINVGEQETLVFRHKMKDLGGSFRPFLRVRPTKAIENVLRLTVVLPEWSGLRVQYLRFTHDTEKVIESEEIMGRSACEGRLVFEKEIFKPNRNNMGHRIEWTHSSQD